MCIYYNDITADVSQCETFNLLSFQKNNSKWDIKVWNNLQNSLKFGVYTFSSSCWIVENYEEVE